MEFRDPGSALATCLKIVIFFLKHLFILVSLNGTIGLVFLIICLGGYISADLRLEYSEAFGEAMALLFCACV